MNTKYNQSVCSVAGPNMGIFRLLPLGPSGSALCRPLLVGGPRDTETTFWQSGSNKPVYMNPIFIRYVHYTIMLQHVNAVSVSGEPGPQTIKILLSGSCVAAAWQLRSRVVSEWHIERSVRPGTYGFDRRKYI